MQNVKRVLVLGAQVPFVRGGAELLNESLLKEINKLSGVQAELVQLPFKWYPEQQIINDLMAWRLLDVSQADGNSIDLVIGTKFPSYAVQHDKKVLWLVHQHRTLYDLENSKFDDFCHIAESKPIRDKIRQLDKKFIIECDKKYTIADNVTQRLNTFNGIEAQTLYPPAPFADKIVCGDYGDYILFIGRLEELKRPALLIEAMRYANKNAKAYFIGTGSQTDYLTKLINKNRLANKCKMLGYLSEQQLVEYLAHCRAVFYAPYDEDYGYATIEAFLAKKPVITCTDSGEVASIVKQTQSGFITESQAENITVAINKVYALSNQQLKKIAETGYEFAKTITWRNVIEKLVLENL